MAVRQGVGLFDMTSFGKIRVEGRDAAAFLNHVCANEVDVPAGRIVYTQMLNAKGGIESDLTVTRLSETAFLLVVPGARCNGTSPGSAPISATASSRSRT
jgi:glycine cleavage system aminomethyltransferase T